MASNSLLALLNFSQPASSPSGSTAAPNPDSAVASSSASPRVASARSPPPASVSASTAANALLQSILSPGVKPQDQFAFPEPKTTSVPTTDAYAPSSHENAPLGSPLYAVTPPSMSAKNSANDLLALLGGSGGSRKQPAAERSSDQGTERTPLQRSEQKVKQRPIGTPPGQHVPRESTRSPVQSIFDSPSLFDMLQQASDKMSNEKKDAKPKSDVSREVQPIELPTGIASASTTFASNLAPSYPINPRLHASYHLSGLHASAGFEDSISSGLDEQAIDDTVNYALDLTSPQPAGSNSLYPAKLEILPISVLTTPFSPSFFVDKEEEGQRDNIAQWPCQRVGSLEGKYALYTMSKGRVRIINQENGFRQFARADTSGIRSIITPQHRRMGSRNVFAAITEGSHMYIWSMEGISQQQDAIIVATVAADAGKTFSYALWRPGGAAEELIVVQSDGSIGVLPVRDLERRTKEGVLPWATSRKDIQSLSDVSCVGAAVSSDGSLLALVQASSPVQPDTLQLRLESLTHSKARYVIDLPSLSSLGVGQISFVSFADQGGNRMPQCLLIGYDSNQVIAVVDLSSGSLKQVIRFKASVPSFSLATWHAASSSLLLCCSMRSSIFSWRPCFARLQPLEASAARKIASDFGVDQGQPLNHSCEVIGRIKNGQLPCSLLVCQPFMKECALPDPYSSVALDGSSDGIHMIATHIGGIHGLHLPEEALKQAAKKEAEAETRGAQAVKASDVANKKDGKLVEEAKKSSEPAKTPRPVEKTVEDIKKPNKAARKADVATPSGKSTEAKRIATPTLVPEEGKDARLEMSEIPSAPALDADTRQQINGVVGYDVKALLGETEARIMSGMQRQAAKDENILAETVNTAFTSLLPKLEATTSRTISGQLSVVVDDAVKRALPSELHQALLRPELVQHLTSAITSSIVPPVRKTAMDVVSQALAPHFEGIMADLQQSMETKMDMAMTGIRKDIVMEQGKALIGAEARIEQLTSQVETLTTLLQRLIEQNGALDKKLNDMRSQTTLPVSTGRDVSTRRGDLTTARHQEISSSPAQTPLYQAGHFSQAQQPSGNYAIPIHGPGQSRHTSHTYSGQNMNSFLPQHLQPPPQPQSPGHAPATTMSSQELEDLLLAALSDPNADTDLSMLRSTLERIHTMYGSPSNALWNKTDTASRPNGRANVSQAVILTLLHRISKILNDRPDHNTLAPEVAVPWLEACSASLDRRDDSIASIFAHIQPDLLNQLIQAHRKLQHRASWWTDERLSYGILHYLR